jgi:uncharacterized membrane protein YraQ (UPF0718 family)
MEIVIKYLTETWSMLAVLAPWLLLGFAIAGLISILLRRSTVVRFLGRPGLGSIVRATIVGVPMPLCSCGVIPVAAAIREKGAGKGATAAFLASTPETGADSFAATWGMLGPFMAFIRVALAFVNGILAGLFVTLVNRGEKDELAGAGGGVLPEERKNLGDAVRYAFIKMPGDMARSLAVGLLLAGAVAAFLPADFAQSFGLSGIAAYLVVTLVAVPLYVCSVGSIPLAAAMIHAGFSPGAALVFLVAGPATNVATIVTMKNYLGGKSVAAYLASIVVTAWTAGFLVDLGLGRAAVVGQMPHAMGQGAGVFGSVAAAVLLVLLLHGVLTRHFKPLLKSARSRSEVSSCCCGTETTAEPPCCHDEAPARAESTCHCHEKTPAKEEHSCRCGEHESETKGDCHCHE